MRSQPLANNAYHIVEEVDQIDNGFFNAKALNVGEDKETISITLIIQVGSTK